MEYPKIISLVPQGEHFDASAVNEGVWLSVAHVNSIEEKLNSNAAASTAVADAAIASANEIVSLTDQLNASKQVITERDATIAAQAIEIANLKAGAAKPAAVTVVSEDANADTKVEDEITKQNKQIRAARGMDVNF